MVQGYRVLGVDIDHGSGIQSLGVEMDHGSGIQNFRGRDRSWFKDTKF